jgi:hypothetical protein
VCLIEGDGAVLKHGDIKNIQSGKWRGIVHGGGYLVRKLFFFLLLLFLLRLLLLLLLNLVKYGV